MIDLSFYDHNLFEKKSLKKLTNEAEGDLQALLPSMQR